MLFVGYGEVQELGHSAFSAFLNVICPSNAVAKRVETSDFQLILVVLTCFYSPVLDGF